MSICSIQGSCQQGWRQVEPYIMPATIAVGVVVVINQIWGTFMACSFAAGVVGVTITFPFLITEITKQDMAISLARLTLIAVLPFFGTWGILASVALAAASAFTQDIRLYNIRAKIKEANSLAHEIKKEREELLIKRKEMLEECAAKNKIAEEFWHNAKPLEEVKAALQRCKDVAEQSKSFFEKVMADSIEAGKSAQAKQLVDTLEDLKKTVEALVERQNAN